MRLTSISMTFAVGLGLGLLAASACGTTTCTALTCRTGCCSNNTCQEGTTSAACGTAGAACSTCVGTNTCSAGVCRSAGTGGGTGGGSQAAGGGSGTGGGVACRNVAIFPSNNLLIADYWPFSQDPGSHYNVVRFNMPAQTAGNVDTLDLEVVYANDVGPSAPFTAPITTAKYSQCSVCTVYYESCNANHDCARTYLGRSGTVNVTRADRAVAGRLSASADTLQYQQWDLDADQAAGDACIIVGQVPAFLVGWNQDGGVVPP